MQVQRNRNKRASGHVALVERKRGPVWYARGRYPDGRTFQKYLGDAWKARGRPPEGYMTERMANDALAAILTDARRGEFPEQGERTNATVRDAVEEWLSYCEAERALRATTLREYRTSAYKHVIPAFGDEPVESITTQRIEQWKRRLLNDAKLSRRTVNKLLVNLHGVFERARRVYGLPVNPVKDVERLPEHYDPGKFDVYSKEEVWALVRALRERTDDGESATERRLATFAAEQDAALVITMAFAGLRLGEALGLRWRDVDFANELLRVTVQVDDMKAVAAPKGKRVRAVPMVPPVAKALADLSQHGYAPGDDDPVFVSVRFAQRVNRTLDAVEWSEDEDGVVVAQHVDRSAFRRRYRAAVKRAGLRPLRIHDLRHTFATLAVNRVEAAQELQDMLGHGDYRTTQRYLHYRQRADAARRLAPAFELDEPEPLEAALSRANEEAAQRDSAGG